MAFSWSEAGMTKRFSVVRSAFDQGVTVFLGAFLSMPIGGSGLEAYVAPGLGYVEGSKETQGPLCHVVPQIPQILLPTFQSLSMLVCCVMATIFQL